MPIFIEVHRLLLASSSGANLRPSSSILFWRLTLAFGLHGRLRSHIVTSQLPSVTDNSPTGLSQCRRFGHRLISCAALSPRLSGSSATYGPRPCTSSPPCNHTLSRCPFAFLLGAMQAHGARVLRLASLNLVELHGSFHQFRSVTVPWVASRNPSGCHHGPRRSKAMRTLSSLGEFYSLLYGISHFGYQVRRPCLRPWSSGYHRRQPMHPPFCYRCRRCF